MPKRRKPTDSVKQSPAVDPSVGEPRPAVRLAPTLGRVMLTLALLGAATYALADLGRIAGERIRTHDRYALPLAAVEFNLPPNSNREVFLAEVRYLSELPETLALLDPRERERLHAAFARHPLVASVTAEPPTHPGQYRLHLTFRQPILRVRVPDSMQSVRVVDRHGVLLPVTEPPPGITELAGEYPLGRTEAGQVWNDPIIQRAVELAGQFQPHRIERTEKGWRIIQTSGRVLVLAW